MFHRHRHAAQHDCKVATPSGSSSSKSQALAQKAIENSKASSLSSAQSGSRNKVMTPKMKAVELMKMRRKAEAANPRDVSANITMDQRFFAVVTDGSVEKTLWIPNVSLSCSKLLQYNDSVIRRTLLLGRLWICLRQN